MRLQELQQREVEILLLSCSGASLGFSFLALLVSAVFFWGFPCFPAPAFSPALPPSITLSIRPPASPPSIPPPISEGEWLEDAEPSKKHQRSCMIRNQKKRDRDIKSAIRPHQQHHLFLGEYLESRLIIFAALVVSHGSVFWYLIFVWTSVSLHDTLSVLTATSKSCSSFYIYIGWWIIH